MIEKRARLLLVIVSLVLAANVCAGSLTWFDYNQTGEQLGANLKGAWENKNWAQHPRYREAACPISGSVGASPAAWSVWKLTPHEADELIESFTVSSTARFEVADDEFDGHAYCQWAASPQGPWQTIYSHRWEQAGTASAEQGAVKLETPLPAVYVRLAADRIGINKYQIGAQANLLFTQWKATGETLSRFKEHTWYEFGYGGPTFGENLDKAFHNENWAQHPGYKQLAGPAGGDNGEAAAYSVWQLSALPGTGISSFTVATSVQNEHAKDYDGHSYVQWSQSPVGPWTTIYSHSWDASWSTTANFGTVKLDSPLAKVYVRIAADKFAWNHYYVDKNGANLRFDKLKITGQLLPLPAEQEKALLQQAQQYLSEARKQGVPKAQYTYQGKNYRLELGEQLTITSLTPGGPREILKNVKIDVFQSGWKGAFNQGRLLFYDVLEENDGDIVLDTTWKPGGPLREQTTVKILH